MKASITAMFALATICVLAQNESELTAPRALFKVAPQNFAINTLKIGTEIFNKSHTKSYSLYLYGRFDSNNNSQVYYYGDDFYKGLGGEFQYRKYISPLETFKTKRGKNYLQGIYVGGYIQASSYKSEGEFIYYNYDSNTGQHNSYTLTKEESVGNWGTGFTIGVHRTLWSVLFIDAYIGGGIQWSNTIGGYTPVIPTYYYSSYAGITSPGYQGIMPKLGLQLGFAL